MRVLDVKWHDSARSWVWSGRAACECGHEWRSHGRYLGNVEIRCPRCGRVERFIVAIGKGVWPGGRLA